MKTKRFFSLFLILTLVVSLWATPQAAAVEDPDIQAKAALLVDVNTDSVVYAKNEHQELYPASLTKVMTALLVLDAVEDGKLRLDQELTASESAFIGLAAAFKVGTAGILSTAITDDVGWTGIIVAWLSQLNTAVIFVVSALISMLHYGSTVAAATFSQVDSSFANMLQGVILFLVLAADFCTRFRVVMDQKGGNDNGNG